MQVRGLGVTAGPRLGRARKSTANLLGFEADSRRGHRGEVEHARGTIRLSANVQIGQLGRVRARLELGQAHRLGGINLGRRANALNGHLGRG